MKKEKGRTKPLQQQPLTPKSRIQKKQRSPNILQTALQAPSEIVDVNGLKNFAEQQIRGLNQVLEDNYKETAAKLTENTTVLERMMEDDFNKVVDVIKEADKLYSVMKEEYDENMGQLDLKMQALKKTAKKSEAQFLKEIGDVNKAANDQLQSLQSKYHTK